MTTDDGWKPYYFSLQRRCRGCGTRLIEPPPDECPGCHRPLQEGGIWSQFTEWEQERQQGRWRFVLRESLWFLIGVISASIIVHFLRTDATWSRTLIYRFFWTLVPVMITFMRWRWSERDYAEWKRRQPMGMVDPLHGR